MGYTDDDVDGVAVDGDLVNDIPNTPPHNNIDRVGFPKINFSCQNVCSLNISKPSKKTNSKLITITRNGADIIFLCDTRLNSDKQIAGVNDITKKLRFMGYTIFHNSRKSMRGTAILISNKLSFVTLDTFCDENCNMLMQKISIGNATLTVGSIYGPNDDDEDFFNQINDAILRFDSDFVIIGGDWNATYDTRNSRQNIDTLNTVSIPSVRRSLWLNQLCTRRSLKDPYRYLYPDAKEFTYIPYAVEATNRSRLDFFLISEKILSVCVNCRIPNNLSSLLFDHKAVSLVFRRDNPYKKQVINDAILKCPDLLDAVNIAAIECYVNHLTPTDAISDIEIDEMRVIIGRICTLQRELVALRLKEAEDGFDQTRADRITVTRDTIRIDLDLLPNLETLQDMEINCARDIFLEILIMAVKNSSLAHQHSFFAVRNARRNFLDKKLTTLKNNFDANSGEILRAERDLNRIVEGDAREEILKMKNFEHLNNEKITPYFLSLAKKPQHF
jgi:exonuclease III